MYVTGVTNANACTYTCTMHVSFLCPYSPLFPPFLLSPTVITVQFRRTTYSVEEGNVTVDLEVIVDKEFECQFNVPVNTEDGNATGENCIVYIPCACICVVLCMC